MRRSERPQPALGKAIRQFRQERGITQEALGRNAGTTGRTLSLIERGHANPTWDTVKAIANALGVPLSELVKAAEGLEG